MATIRITASPAKPNGWGGFSVIMHIDGRPNPLPDRLIETNKTADAIAARDAMVREAEATGMPCAVSMRVVSGRAPNGFGKAQHDPFYIGVNM